MTHDGKILAIARDIIAQRRKANQAEQLRRREQAYARLPELRQLDGELGALMTDISATALRRGGNAGEAVMRAREESSRILLRRSNLLASGGFPPDYTDDIFTCPLCRDSGYVQGKPCACLKALYQEQSVRELSSVLDLRGQGFDSFDLSFYSDVPDRGHSLSPRSAMKTVFTLCKKYAEDFDSSSVSLLFRGSTGLGKTFLSSAIAGVVSEKGYSVVYDTATALVEVFERQKFDRGGENSEEAASGIRRYLGCDLLILDDLGTEMTTSFTQSALYSLINTRLINGKQTIISTNLSEDEMHRRYSPQLASRLEGDYLTLNFYGRDIRSLKRERALRA